MYTTYTSIENKVGGIAGWKDLLKAVGFRFEAGQNDLPPAVFFPQSDPGDRLTQASSNLQALLGKGNVTYCTGLIEKSCDGVSDWKKEI